MSRPDRCRGNALKADFSRDAAKLATRQSSQKVLEKLVPVVPGLIGGSADLTGSNGTLTKLHTVVKPGDFSGNYIHYGVREHGMAAAMNGLALHGGIVPYGGTFLVFSDYCRPSIRLSALMGKRVIYVMTHDSIGLGEDGPTHQPVEQLAALRAMPNINVFRPADLGRMRRMLGDCPWHRGDALDPRAHPPGPAAAPDYPHRGESVGQGRLCADRARGPPRRHPDRHRLRGVARRRRRQGPARAGDRSRRGVDALLGVVRGPGSRLSRRRSGRRPRVGVEAAVEFGWQKWLGPKGIFVGMRGFGASAPGEELYKHFGITAAAVEAAAHQIDWQIQK